MTVVIAYGYSLMAIARRSILLDSYIEIRRLSTYSSLFDFLLIQSLYRFFSIKLFNNSLSQLIILKTIKFTYIHISLSNNYILII